MDTVHSPFNRSCILSFAEQIKLPVETSLSDILPWQDLTITDSTQSDLLQICRCKLSIRRRLLYSISLVYIYPK